MGNAMWCSKFLNKVCLIFEEQMIRIGIQKPHFAQHVNISLASLFESDMHFSALEQLTTAGRYFVVKNSVDRFNEIK